MVPEPELFTLGKLVMLVLVMTVRAQSILKGVCEGNFVVVDVEDERLAEFDDELLLVKASVKFCLGLFLRVQLRILLLLACPVLGHYPVVD